jgi:hypothetical protein
LHKIGSEDVDGCAQNVEKCLRLSLFLERYHKDGDEFLDHIVRVTGDETWVSFVNVETKGQSKQWTHIRSQNKLKMFKQTLFACQKADGNCFLGQNKKGVLMVKFMQQGTTITSEVYCETLNKLRRAGHSEKKTWNTDIRFSPSP